MMIKKPIILIAVLAILLITVVYADTSATISIGLTISEIGEYSGEDDGEDKGNGDDSEGTGSSTQTQTDDEGVAFSITPSGNGLLEEKEYRMRIITNTEFELKIPRTGIEIDTVIKKLILETLKITDGNQVQAAKVLGLSRSKLRYRMSQLGIEIKKTIPN